jgi:cytochrome c biogenesis protein CcdA/thiol-disulfide isomerase/thioredoxin
MVELLVVAFIGGVITGISPCIVPVLPVVVAGGAVGESRARPWLIIAGLVLSFSIAELAGSALLSALGLPQDLLYRLGIVLLLILAAGLMIPNIGDWLERPFSRLGASRWAKSGGGFVLGLSLGLVYIPCAGPVLAAISVAAANHRVSASLFLVTLCYAAGAAVPLLVLALVAQRAATRWGALRRHIPMTRRIAGAVLALTTLAIAFGLFDGLQRSVPGYTSSLQHHMEGTSSITARLQGLSGEHANSFATKQSQAAKTAAAALPDLGAAPPFTGIVAWLNTPGNRPLTLAQLKGKVVLIDFWTYSCINCQRSLPHVEAWYRAYRAAGLVVVGVHTPEFAFEHAVSNVQSAAGNLGVAYPIAVDNNYGTWDAYNNQYWPAEYLIDPTGQVRAYDFGEGGYSAMETAIRDLLGASGVAQISARTDVPNLTPTQKLSPESYLGYQQIAYDVGTHVIDDRPVDYHAPLVVPADTFAFDGVWTDHSQEATAGAGAQIDLHFTANDVYLVIGGQGTVNVSLGGRHLTTLTVRGIPRLYKLLVGTQLQEGQLALACSPGVQAYDFTFG